MRILVVTSVRNEAPFLLEWLAHLKGAGATDFLIFSNDCEDGTHQMLQYLHKAGVVVHIPQTLDAGESPQWKALKTSWKHPLRKICDWALVCDVDEFVNIHVGDGTILDLLDAVPSNTEGIILPWRLFGNNNIIAFDDKPVTKQFTSAMLPNCMYPVAATFFKSLIRTDGRFTKFGVHRPQQKPAERGDTPYWVNGSGEVMPEIFSKHPQKLSLYGLSNGRALVECNHYSLRSTESFMVKRARGLPNRVEKRVNLAYWVERNYNTVEDTSISNMSMATQAKYSALWAIPGIQELHRNSVSWHKNKFSQLIREGAEYHLFSHILIAGDSKHLSQKDAEDIIARYQYIQ